MLLSFFTLVVLDKLHVFRVYLMQQAALPHQKDTYTCFWYFLKNGCVHGYHIHLLHILSQKDILVKVYFPLLL